MKSHSKNILLISADGMRCDGLGFLGNAAASTPNLDRLAAEGTVFERAYCSQPICMPCRASIMTGRYPRAHGVWDNGVALSESERTLPAVLSESGFQTVCHGKCHFRPWLDSLEPDEDAHHLEAEGVGPYYGFQEVTLCDHSDADAYAKWVRNRHPEWAELALHPRSECPDDSINAWKSRLPDEVTKSAFIADRSIASLERFSNADSPFFLWASFFDPHHPYNPSEPFASRFDDVEFERPVCNDGPPASFPKHYGEWREFNRRKCGHDERTQRDWLRPRRCYQGKIAQVDHHIGRVLDALQATGLDKTTTVLFLSDHGTMLGDFGLMQMGPYSQEAMVHIPLLVKSPEARPSRSDRLVSAVDVLPTVLESVGVDVPAGVQGRSLLPLLNADGGRWREELLVENRWGQNPPDGYKILVTQRYKLSVYANGVEGELYDLQTDPHEQHNLFGSAQTREIEQDLMRRFVAELQRTEDPLPIRTGCW